MKILVVEDDDALRAEIAEYLRRRRHELVACSSVRSAKEVMDRMLTAAEAPQAVVCDMGLPDGDGADLYAGYAARFGSCRWILMSGGHDPDQLERIRQSDGLPRPLIVDKPVSLRVLNEHLETGAPIRRLGSL